MAIPTDRGFVIVKRESNGTTTVSISTSAPLAGESKDVFAQHVGERSIHIAPDVQLVKHGDLSWTTAPVRVFVGDGGQVNIAAARSVSRSA